MESQEMQISGSSGTSVTQQPVAESDVVDNRINTGAQHHLANLSGLPFPPVSVQLDIRKALPSESCPEGYILRFLHGLSQGGLVVSTLSVGPFSTAFTVSFNPQLDIISMDLRSLYALFVAVFGYRQPYTGFNDIRKLAIPRGVARMRGFLRLRGANGPLCSITDITELDQVPGGIMERHGMVDYFRSIGFDNYPFLQQFILVDEA
ncbi:hypothetical protein IFR05_016575 [Cadophora sp. M221]|nr:hypothetical protein IFR05_016575 [Cadophora sp. M221]